MIGVADKSDKYFKADRDEIVGLVPDHVRDVLDVGCASGQVGKSIKDKIGCRIVGIETVESVAAEASKNLDEVMVGSAERVIQSLAENSFDLVVMADVLEHMIDPHSFLQDMARVMRPEGSFIISIPNVSHWSVVRMVAQGYWTYAPGGIMDDTHLRWFTLRTILETISAAGLKPELVHGQFYGGPGMPRSFIRSCRDLNMRMDHMAVESVSYQYTIRGCRTDSEKCNGLTYEEIIDKLRPAAREAQNRYNLKNGRLKHIWNSYIPGFVRRTLKRLR